MWIFLGISIIDEAMWSNTPWLSGGQCCMFTLAVILGRNVRRIPRNERRRTFTATRTRQSYAKDRPDSVQIARHRGCLLPVGWLTGRIADAACALRVDCRFICSRTANGSFDKTDT